MPKYEVYEGDFSLLGKPHEVVETGLEGGANATHLHIWWVKVKNKTYTIVSSVGEAQNADPIVYKKEYDAKTVLKDYVEECCEEDAANAVSDEEDAVYDGPPRPIGDPDAGKYEPAPIDAERAKKVVAGATNLLINFHARDRDGIKTAAYLIESDLKVLGFEWKGRTKAVTASHEQLFDLEVILNASAIFLAAHLRGSREDQTREALRILEMLRALRFADRVIIRETGREC